MGLFKTKDLRKSGVTEPAREEKNEASETHRRRRVPAVKSDDIAPFSLRLSKRSQKRVSEIRIALSKLPEYEGNIPSKNEAINYAIENVKLN